MKKRKMLWITLTVLAILSSGCGSVEIKDETFYHDEGPLGAHANNFLSDRPVNYSKDVWDALRFGMTCVDDSTIGDFKRELEELCSKSNCSYDVKKKIADGFSRMESR